MFLRQRQRGCLGGESLLNLLRGVGRTERSWQWSQTEVCSQDIRELSLPGCSLCQVNHRFVLPVRWEKVPGFALALGKEQLSLLMSFKGQFAAVWI